MNQWPTRLTTNFLVVRSSFASVSFLLRPSLRVGCAQQTSDGASVVDSCQRAFADVNRLRSRSSFAICSLRVFVAHMWLNCIIGRYSLVALRTIVDSRPIGSMQIQIAVLCGSPFVHFDDTECFFYKKKPNNTKIQNIRCVVCCECIARTAKLASVCIETKYQITTFSLAPFTVL